MRYHYNNRSINPSFTQRLHAIVVLGLFAMLAYDVQAQTSQTITTVGAGTFNVPPGVTSLQVQAWGGGGGGGGAQGNFTTTRSGGGGGGGTYTFANVAVTPSTTINYTVGAGGTGVSNGNGNAGGTTTFSSIPAVSAIGGNGGTANNGAGAAAAIGVTFNGGAGATVANSAGGGGGGSAGSAGHGGAASGVTAGLAGAGIGGNGAAGTTASANGTNATLLGGGGGGARSTAAFGASARTGGSGFRGQLIITYTLPTLTSFPANACRGEVITLTGTNFIAPLTVTFNAIPATNVTIVNAGQINVQVPAGATSGNVQVTTATGYTTNPGIMTVNGPVLTGPLSICIGTPANFGPSSGGTWSSNNPGIATIDPVTGQATGIAPGIATFTFNDTASGCAVTTANVNVYALPSITTDPSPQSVCSNTPAVFTVAATGSNLTYQWYRGATSLVNGGNISGATTNTLTINPANPADAANYSCVVSGSCAPAAASGTAALTVFQRVVITGQPIVTQSLCTGATANFSVSATGTGLTYQWFNGATQLNNGGNISGATTPNLSIANLALSDASAQYHCVVSGTSPCSAVTSANSALVVKQPPTITGQPPVSQTVCAGDPVNLSVSAIGGELTYQWFNGATPLTDGGRFGGVTTSILTINPTIAADSGNYHCVVSNSCTPNAVSTSTALVVNERPFISSYTTSACSGTAFLVLPATGVPGLSTIVPAGTTYTWANPVVTGGMTGGSAQSGQPAVTQTLFNPTNAPQTATYVVTPTSGTTGNCVGASFVVTVTVLPAAIINDMAVATCSNTAQSVTPTNGGGNFIPTGTTYSWGVPAMTPGLSGGASGSNQSALNFTLVNSTNSVQTAVYMVTPDSAGCPGNTFNVTVTVNPTPTLGIALATQNICSGTAITPIALTNPNGVPGTTTYSWTRNNTTNITGLPSGGGTPIAGILTNNTGVQQTTTFTITAISEEGCPSVAGTAVVIVDPSPTVTPIANQAVCSGVALTPVNIASNVVGATFTWTRTANASLSGMPLSGSGNVISGILTSTSNVNQTTIFTVTPISGGCSNASGAATFTVTVKPAPVISALPTTQTVCGGQPFVITSIDANNVSGTIYSFTKSNNVAGDNVTISGATLSGTLENNTLSPRTVTFTITATANGCPVTTTADVIVSPNPAFTLTPSTQNICSGAAMTTINFPAVAGVTYSWTRTNPTASGNLSGLPDSDTNATSIAGTLVNLTGTPQTTVITVTATLGGCSKSVNVTLNVFAEMSGSVTISASQAICSGSAPAALFVSAPPAGGSGSYTYQWQRSTVSNTGPWTTVGTGTTYQPPVSGAGSPDTFYQLVLTGCQTITSNVVTIETISGLNNTFTVNDGIAAGGNVICSGGTFSPYIVSNSSLLNYSMYTWNVDPAHFSPATGGPVGTQHDEFFGLLVYTDATLGPITAINNTNASVTVPFSITPTVYVRFLDIALCGLSARTFNVTIRPRPVAIPNEIGAICNTSPTGIVISGNITDAAMSFAWQRVDTNPNLTSTQLSGNSGSVPAGGNFSIPDVLTNSTLAPQTATYQVTPSSLGCTGTPILVTVTVNPFLPGAVAGSQTVCNPGDPIAFTETTPPAGGTTYTYQWQSSTAGAAGPYANITLNGNNATYDPPAGLTQTTWYRRVVMSMVSGSPCSVATTTPIVVTVNSLTPGSISGALTICSGGSATLTGPAAVGSGTISYQWQSNTTGCGGTWTDIASATSINLNITGLTQTTYYRRVATSTSGGYPCPEYSNCIAVTVNTVTPGVMGNDETVCGSNPSAFTVLTPATGAGALTYQWQSNTTGCGGTWANISGATSDVYDPPTGMLVTTYFRRITTSTLNGVSCTAIGNCITVTANAVTAGSIAGNQTVCAGGDPALLTSVTPGTGTGFTYQWQSSPNALTWTDISGATGLTYDPPGPVTALIYYRRLTVASINSTACTAASNLVTIQPNFVTPSVVAGDQTLCSNPDPAAFTVTTAATGTGPITYQWQSSTVDCTTGFTDIIGAQSATYNPPAVTQTTYFRVRVISTFNTVACSAFSNCITVISNAKTWNGTVSVNWNTPGNWTPAGVPTAANCVVIPNTINKPEIAGAGYDAYAYSVTVLAGGNLDVLQGNSITVTDIVQVMPSGGFAIENNASLVQINNVANIGNISMKRITQPMYRYDYTYWGSPVTLASNYTLGMLSATTQPDKYYFWNPTNAGAAGNWVQASSATIMNPNRGYIVRAPQTYSTNPSVTQPYTATFIGVPNNGDVNVPIAIGSLAPGLFNDKLNLIGNPYPSGVDADAFLSHPTNAGLIDGTIYFWTHHSPPSAAYPNPFYGNYTYNYTAGDYATYTLMGGVGTAPTGYGGPTPNGYIAAGQGFFVKGLANGMAQFTNAMRDKDNNSTFFRMSPMQRERIWLNLANTQGAFSQTMVGYAEGATMGYDRGLDGSSFAGNFVSFYSVLEDAQTVSVQGRPWPFADTDQVPMGYNATVANTYTIGIDHFDSAFDSRNIYLEDKLMGVMHDLKQHPYTFASEAGRFDDRFVLRYTDGLLSVEKPDASVVGCVAFIDRQTLHVQASDEISGIEVFDLTGKLIRVFNPETSSRTFTSPFVHAQGVYIAKVKLENGAIATAKLANNE